LRKQKEEAKQKQKEIWREEKRKAKDTKPKQGGAEEGLESLIEDAEKRQKLHENISVSEASGSTGMPHKADSSVKAYYREFKKVIYGNTHRYVIVCYFLRKGSRVLAYYK
jgi:hypothetical protein